RGGSAPRRAVPPPGAPAACAGSAERALPVYARPSPRHVDAPPPSPPPPPTPPCLCHASPRGRRRPANDPGAPRPLLALDDADVQPRRRQAPAQGVRPRAPALVEPREPGSRVSRRRAGAAGGETRV